ncbi:MAG TPA: 5,10-methylenetetrahydrofolate reductase [Dehalococcoidia bacterium]|nr:5,10-methylenetetrahydrofolate reductase [Dehalococcoidia bacterium]
MITITEQKPFEEVLNSLEKSKAVYIIGCGACATMLHTGGKSEVLAMKEKLLENGKTVTGWMVIPTACDQLTAVALAENITDIQEADSILVMSCAFGVQTVSFYSEQQVFPALNTLFIGKEEGPGRFIEVCMQCGSCILAGTAGICPLVRCAKSLLNGPCGGSVDGKCEIDPDTPCAWQIIYDRLAAQGRLNELDEIESIKDWGTSSSGGPRYINVRTWDEQ